MGRLQGKERREQRGMKCRMRVCVWRRQQQPLVSSLPFSCAWRYSSSGSDTRLRSALGKSSGAASNYSHVFPKREREREERGKEAKASGFGRNSSPLSPIESD